MSSSRVLVHNFLLIRRLVKVIERRLPRLRWNPRCRTIWTVKYEPVQLSKSQIWTILAVRQPCSQGWLQDKNTSSLCCSYDCMFSCGTTRRKEVRKCQPGPAKRYWRTEFDPPLSGFLRADSIQGSKDEPRWPSQFQQSYNSSFRRTSWRGSSHMKRGTWKM